MTDPVAMNELIRALTQDSGDLDDDVTVERVKPVDVEILVSIGHGKSTVRQFLKVEDIQTTRKWIKFIWFDKRTVEIKKRDVVIMDIRICE